MLRTNDSTKGQFATCKATNVPTATLQPSPHHQTPPVTPNSAEFSKVQFTSLVVNSGTTAPSIPQAPATIIEKKPAHRCDESQAKTREPASFSPFFPSFSYWTFHGEPKQGPVSPTARYHGSLLHPNALALERAAIDCAALVKRHLLEHSSKPQFAVVSTSGYDDIFTTAFCKVLEKFGLPPFQRLWLDEFNSSERWTLYFNKYGDRALYMPFASLTTKKGDPTACDEVQKVREMFTDFQKRENRLKQPIICAYSVFEFEKKDEISRSSAETTQSDLEEEMFRALRSSQDGRPSLTRLASVTAHLGPIVENVMEVWKCVPLVKYFSNMPLSTADMNNGLPKNLLPPISDLFKQMKADEEESAEKANEGDAMDLDTTPKEAGSETSEARASQTYQQGLPGKPQDNPLTPSPSGRPEPAQTRAIPSSQKSPVPQLQSALSPRPQNVPGSLPQITFNLQPPGNAENCAPPVKQPAQLFSQSQDSSVPIYQCLPSPQTRDVSGLQPQSMSGLQPQEPPGIHVSQVRQQLFTGNSQHGIPMSSPERRPAALQHQSSPLWREIVLSESPSEPGPRPQAVYDSQLQNVSGPQPLNVSAPQPQNVSAPQPQNVSAPQPQNVSENKLQGILVPSQPGLDAGFQEERMPTFRSQGVTGFQPENVRSEPPQVMPELRPENPSAMPPSNGSSMPSQYAHPKLPQPSHARKGLTAWPPRDSLTGGLASSKKVQRPQSSVSLGFTAVNGAKSKVIKPPRKSPARGTPAAHAQKNLGWCMQRSSLDGPAIDYARNYPGQPAIYNSPITHYTSSSYALPEGFVNNTVAAGVTTH